MIGFLPNYRKDESKKFIAGNAQVLGDSAAASHVLPELTKAQYAQLVQLLQIKDSNQQFSDLGNNFAGFACIVLQSVESSQTWISDTGANNYMCHVRSLFISMTILTHPLTIKLPNGFVMVVSSIGNV